MSLASNTCIERQEQNIKFIPEKRPFGRPRYRWELNIEIPKGQGTHRKCRPPSGTCAILAYRGCQM
jgi:hypothetical protein